MQLEGFLSEGSNVLGDISDLCATPIGRHPFPEIAQAAEEAISTGYEVTEQLLSMLREKRLHSQESQSPKASYEKTLRDSYRSVQNLQWTLGEVAETCIRAHSLGNKQLLLLRGAGGTGKTHLLCDFAKKRVQAGLSTVILMGHRFLGNDEPWVQLLQQLDLAGTTAKEFVGALESAAQVCNCRALVIVDALNEGNGRILWPAHLASLVARLQESPWIGVILSVRSSYEDLVIKESVRDQAHVTTHPGFQGHTRPPTSF